MPHHENIFPAPDTLNELEYGKFVLANLAAKRAKQIKDGAPPLVRINSNHALSIALAEIAAGKIKPIMTHDQNVPVEAHDDLATLGSLDLGDDGLLLPAFEDDEVELLGVAGAVSVFEDDEEIHEDEEEGAGAESLADLLTEEEEEDEVAGDVASDGAISLDDLAEEEAAEEGEEEAEI
ncbi:MAG: DNA-directed RNA polymerase subunit omega [Armatimonadota bacterium]